MQKSSRRKTHPAMPNADLILMLECSLPFSGVLVEGVRNLYRGADGRAIFETPFLVAPRNFGQAVVRDTHPKSGEF